MATDPVPQRISDADRDAAIDMLRAHYGEGRLDDSEFTERMTAALNARTAADLTPLFADLPDPRPADASTPSYQLLPSANRLPAERRTDGADLTRAQGGSWIGVAQAVLWPTAIGLTILTRGGAWWILLAIVGSIILSQLSASRRQPPPY